MSQLLSLIRTGAFPISVTIDLILLSLKPLMSVWTLLLQESSLSILPALEIPRAAWPLNLRPHSTGVSDQK